MEKMLQIAMGCTLECFHSLTACLDELKELSIIYNKSVYEAGAIKNRSVMK